MRSSSRSSIASADDDDRGIGIFARASYSPPDRNLIDYYADGGLEFIGLSDQRPKDKFGIAAAYAHVSPWARALDTDFRNLSGPGWPMRRFEGLVHRRLPVRDPRRLDAATKFPVHRPSRRRRDQSAWATIPAKH